MPELPEVEVSRQGISPHLENQQLVNVVARQRQLRWWVPDEVLAQLNQPILSVTRRAKYLLIQLPQGDIILHLGMSGHLKVIPADTPATKHDHIDLVLASGMALRLNDTRRFGAVLWQSTGTEHPLLTTLGPEPLSDEFNAVYLFEKLSKKNVGIKIALMDNHVVVGVGNIYATESLFNIGVHPAQPASTLTPQQVEKLVIEVKRILKQAIELGGSTLRDYSNAMGENGYFQQTLLAYGRAGEMCVNCETTLENLKLGQRASVFCPQCQPLKLNKA